NWPSRVSCRGERSAVVRLACNDRGNARARRRAVLLRACAIAALAVQPALAAPPDDVPGNLARESAIADHGPPAVPPRHAPETSMPDNGSLSGNGPGPQPAIGIPDGTPTPVTANRGTFDIAVPPPAASGDTPSA